MQQARKKQLVFLLKVAVSVGILAFIGWKLLHRENMSTLFDRVTSLSPVWVVLALVIQFLAVACSIVRWRLLLRGQGIHAPFGYLIAAFMTGRFFSAVSPGGWTGLDAYRIYEIANRTKKTARSTATVVVDKLLGQSALGGVIVAGSAFGVPYLGLTKVLAIDAAFVALIVTVLSLLTRPKLFRVIAGKLPKAGRVRLQTMVDAVCAYQGQGKLLGTAFLLSLGTHAFTNLIQVAVAHALGLGQVGVGGIFFVSAMQVLATLLPISLNGVGVREAVAIALFARVGVGKIDAFLIAALYFAIDMFVSALGGIFLLIPERKPPTIVVDDADREDVAHAQIERAPDASLPSLARAASLGFGAGLLGGFVLGLAEAIVTLASAGGRPEYTVLLYGAFVYGLACAVGGTVLAFGIAWERRREHIAATPAETAFARYLAFFAAAPAVAIAAFRIRRDVFHELLAWKSPKFLLIALGCMVGAALVFFVVSLASRILLKTRAFSWVLRPWGAPVLAMVLGSVLFGVVFRLEAANAPPDTRAAIAQRPAAPAEAGNVLVIVVDTLRADHLPAYGYRGIRTPHLDAFARDAIRFDKAFANASWTRPSFATIMTGRLPGSHRTMQKSDSLPDDLVTMAEAFAGAGYETHGVVTNYNVGPFFNFHQGFDGYEYLEPAFVLGANDTAAKLLFIQFARQKIETWRAARGIVEVGSAYRDAETVNQHLFTFLDHTPHAPFFLFVGYMDPHDPYYPHPYDGTAYSRAANQTPDPSEAPRLKHLYDGEIVYWDEQFGHLVTDLKRRGLYDGMTIVITSDHGEEFQEHGGFWHGTTLYEEQVHIPLFLKLANNEQGGTVVNHWVQLADVMPTMLQLNGVQVPQGVQGQSLFEGHDQLFAEESHEGNVLSSARLRRGDAEIKLIRANENNPRGLETNELYRLDHDPHERTNLATRDRQELATATQAHEVLARAATQGAVARRAIDENDATAQERLRALGYAGANDAPNAPPPSPSPSASQTPGPQAQQGRDDAPR